MIYFNHGKGRRSKPRLREISQVRPGRDTEKITADNELTKRKAHRHLLLNLPTAASRHGVDNPGIRRDGIREKGGRGGAANSPEKNKGGYGMKWDKREIMTRAWAICRKYLVSFAEALHRAWLCAKAVVINERRIEAAKAAAGITEPVNTWAGWRDAGREVKHGSKAVFGADLIYGSRGDNQIYKARFFTLSQTEEVTQ